MGATSAILYPAGQIVNPDVPQLDLAVAPNFERFDGLDVPDTNPAGKDSECDDSVGQGWVYGFDQPGQYPRPGAVGTPIDKQVYTPGPLKGVVGTIGGQPLAAAGTSDRIHRPTGGYTPSKTHSIQQRLGVGQANQGAAQTVQLSEITSNPPQPGDLSSIIAGLA